MAKAKARIKRYIEIGFEQGYKRFFARLDHERGIANDHIRATAYQRGRFNVNRVQRQVCEFHRAGGHVVNDKPMLVNPETLELRRRLMEEELTELLEAMYGGNLPHIAKELGDLIYVVYGTALSYGLDMDPVSDEVHRSNMTKFGVLGAYHDTCDETGKSIRNVDGKTLKPPGFEPANMAAIVAAQVRGDDKE